MFGGLSPLRGPLAAGAADEKNSKTLLGSARGAPAHTGSHPGEVLREEFLVPLKMSAGAVAKVCGLPRTRIERIASEQTGITADTALRLAKALGTTARLWLNLQNDYDVQIAKRDLGKILDRIENVNKPEAA